MGFLEKITPKPGKWLKNGLINSAKAIAGGKEHGAAGIALSIAKSVKGSAKAVFDKGPTFDPLDEAITEGVKDVLKSTGRSIGKLIPALGLIGAGIAVGSAKVITKATWTSIKSIFKTTDTSDSKETTVENNVPEPEQKPEPEIETEAKEAEEDKTKEAANDDVEAENTSKEETEKAA